VYIERTDLFFLYEVQFDPFLVILAMIRKNACSECFLVNGNCIQKKILFFSFSIALTLKCLHDQLREKNHSNQKVRICMDVCRNVHKINFQNTET
jgi:hypothetical protein